MVCSSISIYIIYSWRGIGLWRFYHVSDVKYLFLRADFVEEGS